MSSILFSGPKIFISNWSLGAYSGFKINWCFLFKSMRPFGSPPMAYLNPYNIKLVLKQLLMNTKNNIVTCSLVWYKRDSLSAVVSMGNSAAGWLLLRLMPTKCDSHAISSAFISHTFDPFVAAPIAELKIYLFVKDNFHKHIVVLTFFKE